jgi:hypothetical protein
MSKHTQTLRPLATAIVLGAGTALSLAACGGSSAAKAARTSVAATTGATGAGGIRPGVGRFAALRECLAKNGIKLPERPRTGATGSPGSGALGQGHSPFHRFQPPAGVSRSAFEAALKRCGGASFGAPGAHSAPGGLLKSATFKKHLEEFSACMQAHGIKLGPPNTSGKGSIFNTNGIDTTTPTFRAAFSACRGDLGAALGPHGAPAG